MVHGRYRPTAYIFGAKGIRCPGAPGVMRDKSMNCLPDLKVGRRSFFRMLAIGTAAVVTNAPIPVEAKDSPDRRRARYRADSREVQTFYRVNRYPDKAVR
jgi:hypothetical protein